MSKQSTLAEKREAPAGPDDIRRVLRALDETRLLNILGLRPTVYDLEQASMWLAGDPDVFGAGQPLKGVAGEIVAILTADEEEEQSRPR